MPKYVCKKPKIKQCVNCNKNISNSSIQRRHKYCSDACSTDYIAKNDKRVKRVYTSKTIEYRKQKKLEKQKQNEFMYKYDEYRKNLYDYGEITISSKKYI